MRVYKKVNFLLHNKDAPKIIDGRSITVAKKTLLGEVLSVQLNFLLFNWYNELQELFCKSREEIENSIQTPSTIEINLIIKQFERLQMIWKEMQDASVRMKERVSVLPNDFDSHHDCFRNEFIRLQEKKEALEVQAMSSPTGLKLKHPVMYHIFNYQVRQGNITRAREIVMRHGQLLGVWRKEALKSLIMALLKNDRTLEAKKILQEITDPCETSTLSHLIACCEKQQQEEEKQETTLISTQEN